MKHQVSVITDKRRGLLDQLRTFGRAEDGTITIFACYMVLIMILVGGIGVDLMRNEMERTRLQGVADNAVLAAADLDQVSDPQQVVEDYFDKAGLGNHISNVDVDEGLNYRIVTVDASSQMKTQFMDVLGVKTLTVPARARAEEKVAKVEISLVLDISGSMNNNNKMNNLKDAADAFIDAVLKEENEDRISVSLVPYSEHVNAGSMIADELSVNLVHPYNIWCLEFPDSAFESVALDQSQTYNQMQHFQWNTYSIESGNQQNTRNDTVCPRNWYERILPFSQNATQLKNRVDRLKPRAGTQIFLGMKWAAAMLDPSFSNITSNLAASGEVDAAFSTRPSAYDDIETLKTVILMTDGQNSSTQRINSSVYANFSHARHWNSYNFNYYLSNYVNYYNRSSWYRQKYAASEGDNLLDDICDAAKEKNIVIWSIGFEVTDHGSDVMENCASSPSHFFRVEGVEISEAFEAIARQINQLRLTL